MNALFLTQGGSLEFFYDLMTGLRSTLGLKKVGFYVSDSYHYEQFLKKHPGFEKEAAVVKEWEIMERARNTRLDPEAVARWEKKLGVPSLWPALIADRRLTSGKLSTLRQDYTARFDNETLLKILQETLSGVDALFESVKPDVTYSFICVSAGEYVAYLMAKARNVAILNLRPTRIRNFMHWAATIFEPSPELMRSYDALRSAPNDRWMEEARAYISHVVNQDALYEGVIKPSRRPHQVKRSFAGWIPRLAAGVARQARYLLSHRHDHHNPGFLVAAWYKRIVNPWVAGKVNRALSPLYVTREQLPALRYAFFPLHTEPEVSLLVYSPANVNQIESARLIAQNLSTGMKLLIKDHPASIGKRPVSYYRKLLAIPNVLLADPALEARVLVQHAALVAVIVGSVALEALILKKPVITLGQSPFDFLPPTMIRRMKSPDQLGRDIAELLAGYEYQPEAMARFVASIMGASVPLDFYSVLLKKGGVHNSQPGVDPDDRYKDEIARLAAHTAEKCRQLGLGGQPARETERIATSQ